MTEKTDEENKIINKTKFAKWFTDWSDENCLEVPTVDIEDELRVLIGFAIEAERKKHEAEVKEARECDFLKHQVCQKGCVGHENKCKNKSCPLNEVKE